LTSADNFYAGRTRDISVGGLFVDLSAGSPALDIGAELTVRLQLLDTEHRIHAEVAWTLNDDGGAIVGIGVQFRDLTADTRRAIENFMAIRPPIEFHETGAADDSTDRDNHNGDSGSPSPAD